MKWEIVSAVSLFLCSLVFVMRAALVHRLEYGNVYFVIAFMFIAVLFLFLGISTFFPRISRKWILLVCVMIVCILITTTTIELVLANK